MGKDSGWNLLSSDRLVPKAAPNKDAAWEASGVFFPTSMASAARHTPASRDRSASPTGQISQQVTSTPHSHTTAAFTPGALRAPAFPASHQCALRRPLRAELRSTFSKGSARRHLVQRMASLTMSSGSASSVPSWVRTSCLPLLALAVASLCSVSLPGVLHLICNSLLNLLAGLVDAKLSFVPLTHARTRALSHLFIRHAPLSFVCPGAPF
jgi:hypothetical protein